MILESGTAPEIQVVYSMGNVSSSTSSCLSIAADRINHLPTSHPHSDLFSLSLRSNPPIIYPNPLKAIEAIESNRLGPDQAGKL